MKNLGRNILCLAAAVELASCTGSMSEFWRDPSRGVPLSDFKPENGKYFPEYILKFFPHAERFSRDYPSLTQARSGLLIVDVRSLTQQTDPLNEANLSWSADGVYLAFELVTDQVRKIQVKNLIGDFSHELMVIPNGNATLLDSVLPRSILSYNAGLKWSRDTNRYAFMSNGGTGDYRIYVGAVGDTERAVTQGQAKDGYANWSPETEELAFVSARSGQGDIYLLNLKSGKQLQLTTSPDVDIFPEWFPDAKGIVYASGDALSHNLFTVRREKIGKEWAKPEALTRTTLDALRPTVSPNGKWIAFYGSRAGSQGERTWDIFVIPNANPSGGFSDKELKNLVVAKDVVIDLNTGPAWSPDGRKIFYVKHDPRTFNPILGYDLFTGERFQLQTHTRMNRDILMSKMGVLSFRAQVGVWDRVFVALTNQGAHLQNMAWPDSKIHYEAM